jgi:hypothetical protein
MGVGITYGLCISLVRSFCGAKEGVAGGDKRGARVGTGRDGTACDAQAAGLEQGWHKHQTRSHPTGMRRHILGRMRVGIRGRECVERNRIVIPGISTDYIGERSAS